MYSKMTTPGVCLNIIKERLENDGEGTINNPKKYMDQDYELLHQYSLARNKRFIDDTFPPEKRSIGETLLKSDVLAQVKWIRPTKLVPNPALIVDGVSRFDFAQGDLGNCWFLAAVGALTFRKDIIFKIIPNNQSFHKYYVGIFHFRFWRFGKWIDVVIDDKLPTIDNKLIFVHPKPTQRPEVVEFWPALLEKAYAKVCGSYEDMKYGWVSEALKDFTGGVHMSFIPPKEDPQTLWDLIHKATIARSLMGCGTLGNAKNNAEQDNGLVGGHAYTVTGAVKVRSNGNEVTLIRLFNPWGHTEWNGNWCDGSRKWMTVSEEERNKYRKYDHDGEFWMSMEDFCKNFCQVDICNNSPAFLDGSSPNQWMLSVHEGRWVAGSTAGGSMDNKEMFWKNPQFPVSISEISGTCEPVSTAGPNVFVSLLQKPDKINRRLNRTLYLGFSIYKTTPEMNDPYNPVFYTKGTCATREITDYTRLEPGNYVIIPYTSEPNNTASFILSLSSKGETSTRGPAMILNNEGKILRQISDHYQEVNAEQLQKFLNEEYVGGGGKSCGFSLDVCQSIVAMLDTSVTGTLSAVEMNELIKKIDLYKSIFFHMDNNRDGILSLVELRDAVKATGIRVKDGLLKLTTLRFADSTGRITLERFIFLALRLSCMSEIFGKLSDRNYIHLKQEEWLRLTMYS